MPSVANRAINLTEQESDALGDLLTSISYELDMPQEYKNDLAPLMLQPAWSGAPGVPGPSTSTQAAAPTPLLAIKDEGPEGPPDDSQWERASNLVA